MSEEEARPETTSTPRPSARQLLRGAFPEAIGLAMVGLIVVAVAACALCARRALTVQRDTTRRAQAKIAASAIANELARLDQNDGRPDSETISKIAGKLSAVSVRWVDNQGATLCAWSRGVTGDAGRADSTVITASAPVASLAGKAAGTVTIGLPVEDSVRLALTLYASLAGVLAAALLAYLALYRVLHRTARPATAIQIGLENYASGIERDLQTLHLSDAFGQVALGWNRLIEEVVELKQQTVQAGASDSRDALSRFESRALRDMLERLPVGVVRFGVDEQIRYVNDAAARFLGAPSDELSGRDVREALGADNETLLGSGRHGVRAAVDWEREGPAGKSTLRVELLPSRAGVDPESMLLIQDVTDLREVEQARNSFLYHVTHELRTPLTNIQAYAETLSRLDFDDEQMRKECYNVIVSETKRLSGLVEDILSISQMEVGAMRLEAGDVDMTRLLRTMVQDNLGAADEGGVELSLSLPPKLPRIRGDKRRLAVLLNNLIGNGIKYTARNGRVSVRATHDERRMRIEVSDTGMGIAPDDCAKVFEKFYRAGSEQVQNVKGTGLGLAIAKEVARLHGGDILLESELGKGSTFTLELPLHAADAA